MRDQLAPNNESKRGYVKLLWDFAFFYYRKIMAVPTIDGIDFNTFRIRPVYGHGTHYRGIFEWGFLYKESEVPQRELDRRKHNSEPYRYNHSIHKNITDVHGRL